MARKLIYSTPEEKCAARQAKNRRYYEKNREQLLQHAKDKYHNGKRQSRTLLLPSKCFKRPRTTNYATYRKATQIIHDLNATREALFGPSPSVFYTSLYKSVLAEGSTKSLDTVMEQALQYQTEVERQMDVILNHDGISSQWKKADAAAKAFQLMVACLEDMWHPSTNPYVRAVAPPNQSHHQHQNNMSMNLSQAEKMYLRREWLQPYKEARERGELDLFFDHLRKIYFEAFPLRFSPVEDPEFIDWTKGVVMKRVRRALFWMRTTKEPRLYREGIAKGKQYELAE
ncbi:hypothetical protein ONZ45_g15674 [Pleurotus djamor]|nr:hypothetical protein ONZ45_g15674 [Pleurotus djamor]